MTPDILAPALLAAASLVSLLLAAAFHALVLLGVSFDFEDPASSPPTEMLDIELVQGTHIIVAGELKQGIYYLEAPQDRRAVFAMPWKGRTLIGTTETPYRGDPADVHPLPAEQAYLLAVYNHYFQRGLEVADIEDSFAGLRVLPAGEGSAFSRPRETILHRDADAPRLLSIYGGKLTSHAHTARQVMKKLAPLLSRG